MIIGVIVYPGKILLLLIFFPMVIFIKVKHFFFHFRIFDSLRVYDGDSNTSPMLGNPYCGDSLPPSQTSSSNHLFLHFHSDSSGTGTGFKLEYSATSKNVFKILCYKSIIL